MGCPTIPDEAQTYLVTEVRFLAVLAALRAGKSPRKAFGVALGT